MEALAVIDFSGNHLGDRVVEALCEAVTGAGGSAGVRPTPYLSSYIGDLLRSQLANMTTWATASWRRCARR
jgi:hypothetical protein